MLVTLGHVIGVVLTFAVSRALSLGVYVSTWVTHNGFIQSHIHGEDAASKLWNRLKKSRCLLADYVVNERMWWPLHAGVLGMLCGAGGLGWSNHLSVIRTVGCVHCGLMCGGKAALRLGHVDLGNFFFFDRGLCVLLAAGAWFSPALLYVAVIHSCCLTYTVGASSGLAQPYSNYLGFEYCRWMVCACIAACLVDGAVGCAQWIGLPLVLTDGVVELSLLVSTGAYYFAQGAGKCRLGQHWFEWPLHNRIENLWINAILRGHLSRFVSVDVAIQMAGFVRMMRVPMNCMGLIAELLGLATVLPPPISTSGVALRAMFHCAVTGMTGLFDWEGIVGNAVVAMLLHSGAFTAAFALPGVVAIAAAVCIIMSDQWAVWVSERPDMATKLALFDAADLPMCWWDSPYMRMFEWSVECEVSPGEELAFPVTLFSPYDTLITDVHTRLMNLKLYPGLDRTRSTDRGVIRSGVWGLLLHREDSKVVYSLVDTKLDEADLVKHFCPESPDPWTVTAETDWDESPTCVALFQFFRGWNSHVDTEWFRVVGSTLGGFHWPGEDIVPDTSPLRRPRRRQYSVTDGRVTKAHLRRIKTWFTGERVLLLEDALIGTIDLVSNSDTAHDRLPRTLSGSLDEKTFGDFGTLTTSND
eukprot:m.21497 g.21497  ORF g.21497 m.21497 type:complete len:641 (+) comp10484_c0_seq2:74-1996(+)